ncbi:DUF72 domain-containing protein [Thermosipho melanesiensis]|uniref:DUF72 domain-containing protein n=1 Tax=Thermosipho melanesiensis TaxID=46541 RepID=UPI000984B213
MKTASFIYIRLHSPSKLYASKYSFEKLLEFSNKIKKFNTTTYVYFNNDYFCHVIKNAEILKKLLEVDL